MGSCRARHHSSSDIGFFINHFMAALVVDPLTDFFDAIRSPLTKDRYEKRLDLFFRHLKIDGSTLK
jgi:hypothetical protein